MIDTPAPASELNSEVAVAVIGVSPLVRSGLAHLLSHLTGFRVALQVERISDLPASPRFPLMVVDAHGLDDGDPEQSRQAQLPPDTHAVVLYPVAEPPELLAALQTGVHALLTREVGPVELEVALQVARQGGLYISPDLLTGMVERAAARPDGELRELTNREVEALRWIARGLTHGQASRRMGLTEATVSTYVKRIRHKLNAGNKAELTRRAIELGYLDPS